MKIIIEKNNGEVKEFFFNKEEIKSLTSYFEIDPIDVLMFLIKQELLELYESE